MQAPNEISAESSLKADQVNDWISNQIDANELLVFMKGSSLVPQCGFSGRVINILDHLGLEYKTINVLANDLIRDGVKRYSNWPTIPQVYFKKEFIGGCDIVNEMFLNGELQDLFQEKRNSN